MKIQNILVLLFSFGLLSNAYTQSQTKTVVFKVRKPQTISKAIIQENSIIVVEEKSDVFVVVEENATFMGGDLETFRKWILEHLKYPESASEKGIEGKVILSFVVNQTGKVINVRILRGVDPDIDREAMRVVNSSPRWKSGEQGGKPVNQQFTIPIAFKLQK
jgi:TonB family protein